VITYTSKSPRPGEVPGVDYHYLSVPAFKDKLAQDYFLHS